ncbi:FAD-dependent monooxygenase [bacterium]|nr:FAD-dependent monooxygenase [bacterium]
MAKKNRDAIVVGARCAGAPTAMLLARKGYKVLCVDSATFPSDTISSLVIHPPGVAALRRWGLLDRLTATGCPPIDTYVFDFGPIVITGAPGEGENGIAYAPRRTVLDKLLADAATESGAEVREGFTVEEILMDGDRVTGIRGHGKGEESVVENARVVIGADGRYSLVARAVQPEQYHEKEPILAGYYAFWSGLPMNGRFETYIRDRRGFAAIPTHGDMTLVIGGWPMSEFEENRHDVEAHYLAMFNQAPEFAKRLRGASLESRIVGTPVSGFFRKPYGRGWALVGDAAYNKDYITAQGITDAFESAELLANALDQTFTGERSYDEALGAYQNRRDNHVLPMFEFTCEIATLEPPTPQLQKLLGAVQGNQDAMDQFVEVNAGVLSPAEFFSEQNVSRIFAQAQAPRMA